MQIQTLESNWKKKCTQHRVWCVISPKRERWLFLCTQKHLRNLTEHTHTQAHELHIVVSPKCTDNEIQCYIRCVHTYSLKNIDYVCVRLFVMFEWKKKYECFSCSNWVKILIALNIEKLNGISLYCFNEQNVKKAMFFLVLHASI